MLAQFIILFNIHKMCPLVLLAICFLVCSLIKYNERDSGPFEELDGHGWEKIETKAR